MNDSTAFAGLQVHTSLKPSLRAEALSRVIAVAASAAGAVSLYWLAQAAGMSASWGAALAALAGGGGIALAFASRLPARLACRLPARLASLMSTPSSPWTTLAVDAGGHWHLRRAGGWSVFTPDSLSLSPFGWMSLQGMSLAAPSRPERIRLVIWSDSVSPTTWRRLRIAAGWLAQRPEGLVVPASAVDPRLLGTP